MQSKSLLIAIAAFAVTTTGTSAYAGMGTQGKARLTSQQIDAFEEAKELKESGDRDKARDVLLEAGVDEKILKRAHKAGHKAKVAQHKEMYAALESGDFNTFKEVVADSPLADIITTEEDFDLFKEAHGLKAAGEMEEAKEIFNELGIERKFGHVHGTGLKIGHLLSELTDEQKDALQVAREANDHEAVQAIMEEVGVEYPQKRVVRY